MTGLRMMKSKKDKADFQDRAKVRHWKCKTGLFHRVSASYKVYRQENWCMLSPLTLTDSRVHSHCEPSAMESRCQSKPGQDTMYNGFSCVTNNTQGSNQGLGGSSNTLYFLRNKVKIQLIFVVLVSGNRGIVKDQSKTLYTMNAVYILYISYM